MRDCFCSDFNEMSKTGSEKQVDEVPQKIKQERALRQYREEKDDIFFLRVGVFCVQKVRLGSGSG